MSKDTYYGETLALGIIIGMLVIVFGTATPLVLDTFCEDHGGIYKYNIGEKCIFIENETQLGICSMAQINDIPYFTEECKYAKEPKSIVQKYIENQDITIIHKHYEVNK